MGVYRQQCFKAVAIELGSDNKNLIRGGVAVSREKIMWSRCSGNLIISPTSYLSLFHHQCT